MAEPQAILDNKDNKHIFHCTLIFSTTVKKSIFQKNHQFSLLLLASPPPLADSLYTPFI